MKVNVVEGYSEVEITIKCPQVTDDIHRITQLLHMYEKKIPCAKEGKTHLISVGDVLYFEAVDKRVFLYTNADIYELALKLYEIEEMLNEAGFIRSSKSQIVNIAKIASLVPDFGGRIEAAMENGEKIIISRQYAKLLKERLGIK